MSSSLSLLLKNLEIVATFLPAEEVFCQQFSEEELNPLFDTMAASFWHDKEVRELFISIKGHFTGFLHPVSGIPLQASPLQGPLDDVIMRCNEMALLIIKKGRETMTRNLELIWHQLTQQYPDLFPKTITNGEEMEKWLEENQSLMKPVQVLNLSGTPVEILPPILNKMTSLRKIYLYDTLIGYSPSIFRYHPQEIDVLLEETLFYRGTLNPLL